MVHFQLNSSQFEGEYDDDSGDDDDSVISEDQTEFDAEATRIEKAIGLVRKLDGILDLLFSFYAPVFEKPESAQAITVFQRMLTEFTHFVHPTRNCHHSQFLLFHCSQKSHVLMDIFVGTLFNLAFESNRSQALRQAAAGYLGSFVARGARVPRETVRTITEVLCRQVDSYRLGGRTTAADLTCVDTSRFIVGSRRSSTSSASGGRILWTRHPTLSIRTTPHHTSGTSWNGCPSSA